MILIENYRFMQRQFPRVWDLIKALETQFQEKPIEVIPAKNGMPNLVLKGNEKPVYIHSQYDPAAEAEAILSKYQNIEEYDCVLFYGVGLGYHIEAFVREYPDKRIILYEPKAALFYHYLCTKRIDDLNAGLIEDVLLEVLPDDVNQLIADLVRNVNGALLVVTLPVYERLYEEQTKYFLSEFKRRLTHHIQTLQVNSTYEKLWVINSTLNFKKVLDTPSLLRDFRSLLKDMPVILVSAGPSLNEEIENLRYIKANKLAYIFSVGSANKTLLAHDILPDAVCSYDPNEYNHVVFKEIIEQNIDTIPLIFGSSIGNETVTKYPGPMIHMLTGQDTVSTNYLDSDGVLNTQTVFDAPSIAILMMEALLKLACGPIILVGQNFAFKNNKFYSSGIMYESRPNTLNEHDQNRLIAVDGVGGAQVYTFPEFNLMRKGMEFIIAKYPELEVINTTSEGAVIAGTTFTTLETVINSKLTKAVVKENWFSVHADGYNLAYALEKSATMKKEYVELVELLDEAVKLLKRIDNFVQKRDSSQLTKFFANFDSLNSKIFKNKCYEVFIKPMARVQFDIFNREVSPIRNTTQPMQKAKLVVDVFGKYLYEIQVITVGFQQAITKLHENIERRGIA